MTHITGRVEVLRNGAPVTTLEYIYPPAISMVSSGEICMAMTGEYLHNPNVDFLTDELRPVCIKDGVEYPLGIYIPGTVETRTGQGRKTVYVEGYDRALRVKQTRTEERIYIAAGTPYMTAIKERLTISGISLYIEDDNADVLQTDRQEWDIGTDNLTIINQLLSEINYYPLWFDLDGYAHLERIVPLTEAPVDRTYRSGEASIIRPETTSVLDTYDAPNVFMAIYNNPDTDEVWSATAVNDQAFSSLSTLRRGRRIMADPIQVENIASQQALQDYIDNVRNESLLSTETVTFYTAINPVHQVNDIIALDHEELQGVYEETEWSLSIGPGQQMSHTARRILII